MHNNPFLLIIGGGILQVPLIQKAFEMKLSVIVFDHNIHAPGMKMAHISKVVSIKDESLCIQEATSLSQTYSIIGVITGGTDASRTVAAIANKLHLPSIDYEVALKTTHKYQMRKSLQEGNIPGPQFFLAKDCNTALNQAKNLSFPLVIKPCLNMGARGVQKILSLQQLKSHFKETQYFDPNQEVIIEEYMEGDEISIDSLLINNQLIACGIADRIIKHPPYFIEIGHILPSQKSPKILKECVQMLEKAAHVLNIQFGPVKGDIKLTPQGPRIIELATRLSGGFMSAYTYPYASGISLIEQTIKLAIGKTVSLTDLEPKYHHIAMERSLLFQKGILNSVENVDKALKIPYIKNIFITASLGTIMHQPKNNVDKIGHIIACTNTLKHCQNAINDAMQTIKIKI